MNEKIITEGSVRHEEDQTIRLDLFLSRLHTDLSRSLIQRSIERGLVFVNSKPEKSKYKLKTGDIIDYKIIDPEIDISHIRAQDIPLNIIYEDQDVILINKQSNLSSHPTPNQTEGTLVNALLSYYSSIKDAVLDATNPKSQIRAGIVHRLDKNTTGVMIVAKNSKALHSLSLQIKHRDVTKKYIGLCYGWPDQSRGVVENYLGRDKTNRRTFSVTDEFHGKKAVTEYSVINSYQDKLGHKFSLIEFTLITGRTHQIRSHCKFLGIPLIGDDLYYTNQSMLVSKHFGINRQLLHAKSLDIALPGADSISHFEAELPDDFSTILQQLICI